MNESARDQERTFRKPLRSCLMKGVMVMILAMLVAAEVFGAAPPGGPGQAAAQEDPGGKLQCAEKNSE